MPVMLAVALLGLLPVGEPASSTLSVALAGLVPSVVPTDT